MARVIDSMEGLKKVGDSEGETQDGLFDMEGGRVGLCVGEW